MSNIELVIKLPKKFYKKIKYGRSANNIINNAIKNGTPLHKGHGRLIDVNEVIKIANKTKDLHGAIWTASSIIESDKAESEDKE